MAPTAIVVPVPEAEPVVGRWYRGLTAAGAAGMPPHVTLLYPFVDDAVLGPDDLERARATLAPFRPLVASFRRSAVFPGPRAVVYVVPDPETVFRAMTEALAASFPEHEPYGGAHPDVLPHLTVAEVPTGREPEIRVRLEELLPFSASVGGAGLFAVEAGRWHLRASLPLGGAD